MALYINTNISSLNAQRALSMNQSSLSTSMQRLATGLRINSASDDAAGYAISQRFTSQVNGLNQASRNANDGVSLAQTAAGDLTTITTNLQTMRDLAVQAANASNTASDRAAINTQLQSLSQEIERVAQNSSFNGTKLLDGSFTTKNFQVGANTSANDTINISAIGNATTASLGSAVAGFSTTVTAVSSATSTTGLAAGDLTLNGQQIRASVAGSESGQSSSSGYAVAAAINALTSVTGVTAVANATVFAGAIPTGNGAIASDSTLTVNGVQVGAIADGGAGIVNVTTGITNYAGQGANVAAAINLVSARSGVTAAADSVTGAITLTAADGRDIALGASFTTGNSGLNGAAITATTTSAAAAPTTFLAITSDPTFTVNGVQLASIPAGSDATSQGSNLAAAFNAVSSQSGVTAASVAGVITLTNAGGGAISLGSGFTAANTGLVNTANDKAATNVVNGTTGASGTVTLTSTSATGINLGGFNAGNAGFTAAATSATVGTTITSISSIDTLTAANATKAITAIDGALATVNTMQASLGTYQNRFTSVVDGLTTTSLNLTASRSRITDADFAQESANLSRAQVLQQAGTAMLAQANQSTSGVMALLR